MTESPRLARILDLIPFIFTHQGVSIQELAEKFVCSEKEIYQDLDMLLDCGLPGHTPLEAIDVIFEEGFVYIRNSEELKNPRTLTQAEIATQIIGLELLGSKNNQRVSKLMEKLSKLLKTNVAYAPSETDRYVALLQEAIQNSNLVQIQYGASTRQVIPNELYGRVHGARRTLVWGVMPLGSLCGGFLATYSLRLPYFLGGAVATAIALYSFRWLASLNQERLDAER